jgi:hypothetical protein
VLERPPPLLTLIVARLLQRASTVGRPPTPRRVTRLLIATASRYVPSWIRSVSPLWA